jgi:hypothetical protein
MDIALYRRAPWPENYAAIWMLKVLDKPVIALVMS